jgi:hypothetical protein
MAVVVVVETSPLLERRADPHPTDIGAVTGEAVVDEVLAEVVDVVRPSRLHPVLGMVPM